MYDVTKQHNEEELDPILQAQVELIELILLLLQRSKLPDNPPVDPKLWESPSFQRLYAHVTDLRALSFSLQKGDLNQIVYSKGFVVSNLKALQSNLRHLTWQTRKVADGDFSQKVDFLGDFSDAFNQMTEKLRDASDKLHKLASLDALTHIANRLTLEHFLTSCFEKAAEQNKPFSVLMIDIDFFKSINDNYGHDIGDKVLVKVSDLLQGQFRATDLLARYGGEEFVATLPGADLDTAFTIAQRAQKAVEQFTMEFPGIPPFRVTVSVGVSSYDQQDKDYNDIVKRSDNAMYKAKQTGRNRVCKL